MDLRKNSDARSLEIQATAYIKTKRPATAWYIAITVMQNGKRGLDTEGLEETRSKRQKVFIV